MAMKSFIGAKVVDLSPDLFSAHGATFRKTPAALEMGVTSFGSLFGFGAALSLIESVGIDTIEAHNRRLQSALRATVRGMGFVPNSPDEDCAGICVIPVEGVPEEVSASLQRHGLVVTPRGGGLRISAHIFNEESCIQRLEEVFRECGVSPQKPSASA
jgi:cysteine desulfurase/selenocysteine lyase